jgi:uncharacterized protein YfaS (alpha-2-macroglobulin family)
VQARLGASLPGLRRYFEAYPFTCLEQQASAAIGLRDPARWAALMQALPTHLDADGLADLDGIKCRVQRPGQHPGGRFWWCTPVDPVYVTHWSAAD